MGANRAYKRRQQRELVLKGLKALKTSRRAFKSLLGQYSIKPTLSNQAKSMTEMLEGAGREVKMIDEEVPEGAVEKLQKKTGTPVTPSEATDEQN